MIRPEPRPLPDPHPPINAWRCVWAVVFAVLGIALMAFNGHPTDPPVFYLAGIGALVAAGGFAVAAIADRIQ